MAVHRDYGSFARATQRYLPALVSEHGYLNLGNGFFGRRRDAWVEGFGLQQTQYGDGSFCINMGINVPALAVRWLEPQKHPQTFCIAFRLSERGADQGDAWLPAGSKSELLSSLEQVSSWLPLAEPWFREFKSSSDVARVYRNRTNLSEPGSNAWHLQLMAANYGFLLAEAGELAEARRWLGEAERLMSRPVYFPKNGGVSHEKEKGARLQKPTSDELRQLDAVRATLQELAL